MVQVDLSSLVDLSGCCILGESIVLISGEFVLVGVTGAPVDSGTLCTILLCCSRPLLFLKIFFG